MTTLQTILAGIGIICVAACGFWLISLSLASYRDRKAREAGK